MYYIFCNPDFKNAVKEIPLASAKKMYSIGNPNCSVQYYEIWELSDSDYITISETYIDEEIASCLPNNSLPIWKENWGWWRWCEGACYSVELSPTHTFTVNGNDIELYYDEMAIKDYANNILEDPNDEDYWPIDEVPEDIRADYFTDYSRFNDIFDYCSQIWGASTEKNRIALIVANAKLNNIPTYEFMRKVVG